MVQLPTHCHGRCRPLQPQRADGRKSHSVDTASPRGRSARGSCLPWVAWLLGSAAEPQGGRARERPQTTTATHPSANHHAAAHLQVLVDVLNYTPLSVYLSTSRNIGLPVLHFWAPLIPLPRPQHESLVTILWASAGQPILPRPLFPFLSESPSAFG